MRLLHSRLLRWSAVGAAALILTIYSALMLGLNVPSVRAVPLAPWTEGGYGADRRHEPAAIDGADDDARTPGGARPLRPARVAGVRVPASPRVAGAPTSPPSSKPSQIPPLAELPAPPPAPTLAIPEPLLPPAGEVIGVIDR